MQSERPLEGHVRASETKREVDGRPNFRDVGAGLAMKRFGFGDDTVASVLGHLPDLDIPVSEIERHAGELHEERRRVAMRAEPSIR